MDARIYVRKFVCITNAYLEVHVCYMRNYAKYLCTYEIYVSIFIMYVR